MVYKTARKTIFKVVKSSKNNVSTKSKTTLMKKTDNFKSSHANKKKQLNINKNNKKESKNHLRNPNTSEKVTSVAKTVCATGGTQTKGRSLSASGKTKNNAGDEVNKNCRKRKLTHTNKSTKKIKPDNTSQHNKAILKQYPLRSKENKKDNPRVIDKTVNSITQRKSQNTNKEKKKNGRLKNIKEKVSNKDLKKHKTKSSPENSTSARKVRNLKKKENKVQVITKKATPKKKQKTTNKLRNEKSEKKSTTPRQNLKGKNKLPQDNQFPFPVFPVSLANQSTNHPIVQTLIPGSTTGTSTNASILGSNLFTSNNSTQLKSQNITVLGSDLNNRPHQNQIASPMTNLNPAWMSPQTPLSNNFPLSIPMIRPNIAPLRRGRSKSRMESQQGCSSDLNLSSHLINPIGRGFGFNSSTQYNPFGPLPISSLNPNFSHRLPTTLPLRRGRSKTKIDSQGMNSFLNIPSQAVKPTIMTMGAIGTGSSLNSSSQLNLFGPPPIPSVSFNSPLMSNFSQRLPTALPLRRGRSKTKIDSQGGMNPFSNISSQAVQPTTMTMGTAGTGLGLNSSSQLNLFKHPPSVSFNSPLMSNFAHRLPAPLPTMTINTQGKGFGSNSNTHFNQFGPPPVPSMNINPPMMPNCGLGLINSSLPLNHVSNTISNPFNINSSSQGRHPVVNIIPSSISSQSNLSSSGLIPSTLLQTTTPIDSIGMTTISTTGLGKMGPGILPLSNQLPGVVLQAPSISTMQNAFVLSNKNREEISKIRNEISDETKKAFYAIYTSPLSSRSADDFQRFSLKDLKLILKLNDRSTSGNKTDLAEQICDYMKNGCPPRCPQCGGGRLKIRKRSEPEEYFCPGYFDDDEKIECDFTSKTAHFNRVMWINP